MSHQYWAVGATWGGGRYGDAYEDFIRYNRWYCGFAQDDQPAQVELTERINVGDRIAIKKMLGMGATEIMVRAIGIVKDTENANIDGKDVRLIHVDWVVHGLNRLVPCVGAFKAIQGPYGPDDAWTRQVFQL